VERRCARVRGDGRKPTPTATADAAFQFLISPVAHPNVYNSLISNFGFTVQPGTALMYLEI
jgi:hypothetical protein